MARSTHTASKEDTDMKLFSVSASWHPYRCRHDMIQTAIIMAETREEAKEKFIKNVSVPEGSHIGILEWEDGIYTTSARKIN